ncbi:MAG: bifunctional UDP-N-acetylglucosamine diphosphorylase/glucosamine-1-phosphate N-acetyltransferase GlmU [Dehalococcoidia bacterium]|jgi:bifunctional UDP-N-acetylglucosamine pyrophosphorylase/glucosamine-1-phosphate N-acetyltransferase
MTVTGLILAAGSGSRMKSETPKPLHKVAGWELLRHTIHILESAGIDDIVVVASKSLSEDSRYLAVTAGRAKTVVQREQLGTADAVAAAKDVIGTIGSIVVSPVDMVLVEPSTVADLMKSHSVSSALVTVLGVEVEDPTGLGRIRLRSDGNPQSIVEEHEADTDLLTSNLINTSWYAFEASWLWDQLGSIEPASTGEVYLPRTLEIAAKQGRTNLVRLANSDAGMGINDRAQLARVESKIRARINAELMTSGVTLRDPATTYIDMGVSIGRDTELENNVNIRSGSTIGDAVNVSSGSDISGSQVGNGTQVVSSRIVDSTVGDDCVIGPNAYVRNGSVINNHCKIGHLAEVKNSTVGENTSISHFGYIGDAEIGRSVNVGAGTITCNYDGVAKHSTHIEDEALIGSSTMLVAPVRIGKAARTGAGSVIKNDVNPGDTVVGVPAKTIRTNTGSD